MSEDIESAKMKADTGTESFGHNKFLRAVSGKFDPNGYKSSLIVMIALVLVVFWAMKISTKKEKSQKTGKELAAPTYSRDESFLSPKLLTERDLTNVIRRPKSESSALGKIKIVSLRRVSEIPVGSEATAVLESGATDGIIKAKLTAPLMVDGEPLLPEHAVLFGKGKSTDERLMVEFQKVILPSGESFQIRAQAFDSTDKILGLKGSVVGTRTKKMAAAMGFGLLGGLADGLQDTSGSSIFSMNQRKSVRDAALSGASKAALDQSQAYIEEMKKSPNIIEVKSGTEFVVIIDEPKNKKEESYESK